tara:strand:+ start:1564 stop:2916 length:1353 start_codon:yes stop_codon:yes gene_type:complete
MSYSSCSTKHEGAAPASGDLLPTFETALTDLAQVWYPRAVDSIHGGYWSDFDARWTRKGAQHKMIVSQARHVWTASRLALFYGDKQYQEIAGHGYRFLKDHMWDTINGGFYTQLSVEGDSLKTISTGKSAYGNSFAIYALATYYKTSKDTTALNLAIKTFNWLEAHSHDPVYKGYFDVLQQDGSWMLEVTENNNNYDNFVRKDWKDQNSTIHLLESFTALYEVWPDPLLKERLEELLFLVRDTITTDKGSLSLHLQRDWTPVSLKDSSETYRKQNFWLDHISFGHDVETAFLMLEASHVLGFKNDTVTAAKAKKMVDHGIDMGWDTEKGGFYDGGYYFDPNVCTIVNDAKVWWTEAEGLNSLLLMAELYPKETRYFDLFQKQWAYIDTFMVDHENGGWYHEGLDTNPDAKNDAKAHIWKTNYHNIRSLVNVIEMLRGDFPLTGPQKIQKP